MSQLFELFFSYHYSIYLYIYLYIFYHKVIVYQGVVHNDIALHLLYGIRGSINLVVCGYLSGVACTDEVSSLFRGELNPVAAKAQKKVQIPEG